MVTPLYVSVSWTLIASYQLFTQTAVTTIIPYIGLIWPSLEAWLSSRIDMIVFVYAFAWVFVLSSVIPSKMLGKERSVMVQFIVCLAITFTAFIAQDLLLFFGGKSIDQLFGLNIWFHNPFLATVYLLLPYLLMLTFDVRSRRNHKTLFKGKTSPNTIRCPECGFLYDAKSTFCPFCYPIPKQQIALNDEQQPIFSRE